MNRAPAEGDDAERDESDAVGENGSEPRSGLAARLSGPVAGVRDAYQRAASKFTPAPAAVVVDTEPTPKYLNTDGAAVDPAALLDAVEAEEEADPEAEELSELVEESEEEIEVEAAELAPVVTLPDPEEEADEQELAHDDTVTVVVLPDEESDAAALVTARRVRKVVRRIDPVSVFKLSAVFYVCLFVIFLIAGVLLWSMAVGSGSIDNIESFIVDVGFEDFTFVGSDVLRGFLIFGAGLVVVGTLANVLLAVLFNLISDLVGGIRYTVIEPLDPDPATDPS